MSERTFLVTGSMGCIGAWALYHLARQGERVVSFDLSDNRHRVGLLLSAEEQRAIAFERGDLRELEQVKGAMQRHGVTHVVHLGALQVPFCKADPVTGAQVNVVGTVNIFEAARQLGLAHVAYASSIAVYGPPEGYPPGLIAPDAPLDPHTLYGVYKRANEGTARVYWEDHAITSTALRPYTVYGMGRDQGLTSEPTKAMLAAAAGQSYAISFSGTMQFQYASDVAQAFLRAAVEPLDGAYVFNLGTPPARVEQVAAIIEALRPAVRVSVVERRLPFPEGFDDAPLRARFPDLPETPLETGVRATIERFEACLADGRLEAPVGETSEQ